MVTLSEFLNNFKGLLDKFYTRTDASNIKVKNTNNQLVANTSKFKDGILVTDHTTGELIITPSIPANTGNMISGLSAVATSGKYTDLDSSTLPTIPKKTSDLNIDNISVTQTQSNGNNTYTIGSIKVGSTTTTLYGLDTDTKYTASTVVGSADTTTGSKGESTAYARADHTHQKSDIYAPKSHTNSDGSIYGQASSSVFGHSKATKTKPSNIVNDNAVLGTDNGEYARYDHQHKIEATTVTGLSIYDNTTIGKNSNNVLYVKDKGIGTNQLNDNAVTTDKISNGTIKLEDLNSTDVCDDTNGGAKDSTKLVTSGTLYNTLHTIDPSTMWILVSEVIVDETNDDGETKKYGQKIWYHPLTGMVEMWLITPYRILGASYDTIFKIQPQTKTDTLNSLGLSTDIHDYLPHTVVHGIGRGQTSSGGALNIIATVTDSKWRNDDGAEYYGVVYGKSANGNTISKRRFDLYFTYRCKYGHKSTDFNNLTDSKD